MTASLTLDDLRTDVASGAIDTVVVAITDMQGRLQGKRMHAPFFLDEVVPHGTEGCNYLLAVDVDMNTVDGYAMSSWASGYGDLAMRPDLDTLRRMPWQPGTALVQADVLWLDGSDVVASPRQILRRQLARLAEHGLTAYTGTELEFILFKDSYEAGLEARLPRSDAGRTSTTSTTRCSAPPASNRCCAASATRWPVPGSCRRARRASATSASTRSPSATRTR